MIPFAAAVFFYGYYGMVQFNIFFGRFSPVSIRSIFSNTKGSSGLFTLNSYYIFIIIFCLFSFIHFVKIFIKARKSKVGYSYYEGESNFSGLFKRLKITDYWVRMLVEPLLSIAIGLVVILSVYDYFESSYSINKLIQDLGQGHSYGDPLSPSQERVVDLAYHWYPIGMIGMAIAFNGLCLFLREFGISLRKRGAVLDLIDSEKDMEYIVKAKEALEQKSSAQNQNNQSTDNEGFNLVTIPGFSNADKKSLKPRVPIDEDVIKALKNKMLNE